MVYYATVCSNVPTYMTAVSLVVLCIIVSIHVLHHESLTLWYISAIVEALLFVYSSGFTSRFTVDTSASSTCSSRRSRDSSATCRGSSWVSSRWRISVDAVFFPDL